MGFAQQRSAKVGGVCEKHGAKFPFHIRRLRLNHDVGYCNICSQPVVERLSFAARENAFRLPAPKHGPHLMPRKPPSRHTACLYRHLAELPRNPTPACKALRALKNPNSSSATLTADVVEDLLEWHPRLAGRPAGSAAGRAFAASVRVAPPSPLLAGAHRVSG